MTAATGLNILVLHNLGDPSTWRASMAEKELCLPLFAPQHNYCVHDCFVPLPAYVRDIHFDGVILTQTFLSKRQDPVRLRQIAEDYGFLPPMSAVKIALPQDDYTCSAILDRWMVEWNVDLMFPVCVTDWDELYPLYSRCGELRQGFTGYVSGELIAKSSHAKPITSRAIDVSYRAANLSPVFGRMGQVKAEIGKRFYQRAQGTGLKLDLSTDPRHVVVGSRWYEFVAASKSMIGTNSGSSLVDPEGKINVAVHRYLQRHPVATFDEVEAACFPGLDGLRTFTAISPRNYECALFGTTQLLTPGPYGGYLQPWQHYVPLEPDMSNFDDVLSVIRDHKRLHEIANRSRDAILSFPELRYENHVTELLSVIENGSTSTEAQRAASGPLLKRFNEETPATALAFWNAHRVKTRLRETIARLGARRAKYFLFDVMGK